LAKFLAQHVPVIQKKVYDFAQEAIEYIRTLVEVVGEDPTAKEDLKAIWCVSSSGSFMDTDTCIVRR
jgi:hypothetical protein